MLAADVDVVGLAIASRHTDYVTAVVASAADGPTTVFGHDRRFSLYDAAMINGTAAHGEYFDDTFESDPVYAVR